MKKSLSTAVAAILCLTCFAQPQPEIVGGDTVANGDYPFMATLLYQGSTDPNDLNQNFFCGGTLISDQWVLSAAHCLMDFNDGTAISASEVEVGFNIYALEDPNSNWIHRMVDTVIVHPDFLDGSDENSDIGLIKLSQPITGISPIQLPLNTTDTSHEMVGMTLRNIGFGSNEDPTTVPVFHQSDTLMFVDLTVISVDSAKALHSDYSGLNQKALPTLGPDTVKDKSPCFGDSGGPLFDESVNPPVQVGIVSWGSYCGDADYAAVFARVSAQMPWIRSHISNISTEEEQEVELAYVGGETLFLSSEGEESTIHIYDVMGRVIKNTVADTKRIDLSDLKSGYYVIALQKGAHQNQIKYVAQ